MNHVAASHFLLIFILSGPGGDAVFLSDPERSLEDWIGLGKSTLVLKCQQLGLSQHGTVSDLAGNLCRFYESNPSSSSSFNVTLTSSSATRSRCSRGSSSTSTVTTSIASGGARSRRTEMDPSAPVVQQLIESNPASSVFEPISSANNQSVHSAVSSVVRESLQIMLPTLIDSCTEAVTANFRANSMESAAPNACPGNDVLPWGSGLPFGELPSSRQARPDHELLPRKRKDKKSKKSKKSKKKKQIIKLVSSSSSSSSSSESDSDRQVLQQRVRLPPLDSSLIRRIAAGKKCDFDLLLPCSSALRSEGFELRQSYGDGGVYFAPKARTKAKVSDFFTWCQAWSVFAMYYTYYHAHRAAELWGYFHLASELATRYIWQNFQNYDFQFRTAMDEDRRKNLLRWDRIDECLKARFLTDTKPVCFNCRNFGHKIPDCPYLSSRRGNAFSESSTQSRTNTGSSGKKPAKEKIFYCFEFNKGSCDDKECKYSHSCQICGKNHAKVHCPSRN